MMETKAMKNCNGITHETIKIRDGWAGQDYGNHFRYKNIFETTVLKAGVFVSLY